MVGQIATTFNFGNLSHVYDGNTKTATVSSTPSDATFDYQLTAGPGADSYTVTATANGNFSGSGSATLTIARADQSTVTISPANPTVTVGSAVTFTASGGGVGGYVWSGSAWGTGGSTDVTFNSADVTTSVYVQSPGDANHNGSNVAVSTITVTKIGQSLTFPQPGTQTYGTPLTLGATASSGLPVSYSIVSGAAIAEVSFSNVQFSGTGNVTVRASQAGNDTYSAATPVDRTFSVGPASASFSLSATSFPYNGTQQGPLIITDPAGVIYNQGGTLLATNAGGPYTATAQATGNHTGSNNALNWSITQVAQASVSITSPASMVYGNMYQATAEGGSGTGALEWALGSGSTAPGPAINASGVVTATGLGSVKIKVRRLGDTNYVASSWTADFPITVGSRAITVTRGGSKPYDGNTTALNASASVLPGALAPGDSIDYNYGPTSSAVPGSYSILVTPMITNAGAPRTANYTPDYAGSYVINLAPVTAATIAPLTYTGASQSPSPGITTTTPAGATVNVSAPAQTNANTYNTATVSGTGNYSNTLNNVSWTIAQATQASVSITSPASMVYGNMYQATAEGGSGTGALEWALGSGSTAPGPAINASGVVTATGLGTVKIKVRRAGDSNYLTSSWSGDFTVTVTSRPITVTLSGSKPHDGTTTATNASASVLPGALAPGDSIEYAYNNTGSANPGSYTNLVTATMTNAGAPRTGNYTIAYDGNYVIRAPITAATVTSLSFTGSSQSPTTVTSITPTGATVSVSAPAQINVGTYNTATVTGTGDFCGTLTNVPWSIIALAQANVSINSAVTTVYGDTYTATAVGGSGTGALEWALGTGSTAEGAAINATSGVITANSTGTVKFKARRLGDSTYPASEWTADFTVTVTARPLAVSLAGTKVYDGTTTGTGATLTLISGTTLAPGDALATYVAPSANAATYALAAVTITNASAPTTRTGSYSLTFSGNYTISRKFITAATIAPLTYNGTAQKPTVAATTTPPGATVSVTTATQIGAGDYTATVTGTGNYDGIVSNVPWTINKALPVGTFPNRARGTQTPTTYSVAAPDLNAVFAPAGPEAAAPSGTVTYAIIATVGVGASPVSGPINASTVLTLGTYTIRASYPGDTNYLPATVDSVWSIVLDVDGDGVPGYIEIQLGTDPNVANNTNDTSNQTGLKIHRPNP